MKIFPRWALLAFALLPSAASAEPIKLKLSMITSDRSLIYQAGVKSFVDVDNTKQAGLISLGRELGMPVTVEGGRLPFFSAKRA